LRALGEEGGQVTEATGLDRLENAVRANLADAKRQVVVFRERHARTPWWRWDIRRVRERLVATRYGEVRGYGAVLELIEWTRIQDARAQSEAKES